MKLPYMPLWVMDYEADTDHLSLQEHGAYFALIRAYWKRQGALPDDETTLARLTRAMADDMGVLLAVLSEFFVLHDGLWYHKRVEEELKKATSLVSSKSEGGKEGARRRWGNRGNGIPNRSPISTPNGLCNANQNQNQNQRENQSQNLAQERVTPSAVADDLATLCNRHRMNYEAMAMLVRQGYGASEIELAILKAKANGKTPNNWAPYLKKLCDSERENPTPPAPPPKEGPKVIKLSEAERAMIEGRRNHEGLQATT